MAQGSGWPLSAPWRGPETPAEVALWFRVWERRSRGPRSSPRREKESSVTERVWEPPQDLTLQALQQLNKLTMLPLPIWTELALQPEHTQTRIWSFWKAFQLLLSCILTPLNRRKPLKLSWRDRSSRHASSLVRPTRMMEACGLKHQLYLQLLDIQ